MTSGEGTEVVDPPGAQSTSDILVRVEHVAKAFGPTRALRDCSFELRAGEVHALVGRERLGQEHAGEDPQRGARARRGPGRDRWRSRPSCAAPRPPRSTASSPSSRRSWSPRPAPSWTTSGSAPTTRGGPGSPPGRSGARRRRPWRNCSARRSTCRTVTSKSFRSVDRQACCIVRALLRRPRILILDEATSALDVATRDRLFALVSRLAAEGVGVIFITHRMDEIDQIGDRITVMRSGETVAGLGRGTWTPRELVRLMTGADELVTSRAARRPAPARVPARGAGAERARPAAAPRRPADRPGGPRRASSSGSPGSRATGRTSSSRRCGARTSSRARSSATCPAARSSSAPPMHAAQLRHRLRPPGAAAWTRSSAG